MVKIDHLRGDRSPPLRDHAMATRLGESVQNWSPTGTPGHLMHYVSWALLTRRSATPSSIV